MTLKNGSFDLDLLHPFLSNRVIQCQWFTAEIEAKTSDGAYTIMIDPSDFKAIGSIHVFHQGDPMVTESHTYVGKTPSEGPTPLKMLQLSKNQIR